MDNNKLYNVDKDGPKMMYNNMLRYIIEVVTFKKECRIFFSASVIEGSKLSFRWLNFKSQLFPKFDCIVLQLFF
jgi:hypothetical protein